MSRISLSAFVLTGSIIAGCGSIPRSYELAKEEPFAGKSSVSVVDTRAPIDRVMSVDEGPTLIIKYGDSDFSPDRIEIFRSRLQKELAAGQKEIKVEISRFSTTVGRGTLGTPGGPTMQPQTTWVVKKPDGSIPASYAAGSAAGNAIGTAVINSDWFKSQPSSRASLSTLIQGTVNGVAFLGNDSANVKVSEVGETMPKVIDTAIQTAIRDIKRRVAAADAQAQQSKP
jgi:hypothetical protein